MRSAARADQSPAQRGLNKICVQAAASSHNRYFATAPKDPTVKLHQDLPPLMVLCAFEAGGRRLSFIEAGDEQQEAALRIGLLASFATLCAAGRFA